MSDNIIRIDKEIFGDLTNQRGTDKPVDKDPLGLNLLSGAEQPIELNLDDIPIESIPSASAPAPAPTPAPAPSFSSSGGPLKTIDEINKEAESSVRKDTSSANTQSSGWFSGLQFGGNSGSKPNNPPPVPIKTQAELAREKNDLLAKLNSLERRGITLSRVFDASSDIEELRIEYGRIKATREMENSVRFQKKMLMAAVTGIEYLNKQFDPFDAELEGWSESVHENQDEYDDIFEELYEKYKDRAKMAPEIRLLFSLGGSALMFHLTKTLLKNSIPGMDDILKQNPEIARQVTAAAARAMGGGGNSGGDSGGGGGGGGLMGMMSSFMGGGAPTGAPVRSEMQGPGDVNEILRELDTASAGTGSRAGSMPRYSRPSSQARDVSIVREDGTGNRDMRVSVERSDANTLVLNV
jgi:hypothetical protein